MVIVFKKSYKGVYTMEQTSSRRRANFEQTLSKHQAGSSRSIGTSLLAQM